MTNSITAVIPVFNGDKYIEIAIQSLIFQTIPLDRIIVIDDGSTDNTCFIVQTLMKNHPIIDLIILEDNKGVSAARNKGCKLAKTKWILLLDADDIVKCTLVENMLSQTIKPSDILIHSAYAQINEQGEIVSNTTRFKQVTENEILGYELVRNHVYTSGTFLRRNVFIQCGGFNEAIHLCEDWDLWIKMAQRGRFIYIDEELVLVRRHTINTSNVLDIVIKASKIILKQYELPFIRKAIERRKLPGIKNTLDYVSILFFLEYWNDGGSILKDIQQIEPNYPALSFYLGIYYIHENNYKEAENHFNQAVKCNEFDAASWNNLGVCLGVANKVVNSNNCFKQAIKLVNNYMDAIKNLELNICKHTDKEYNITLKELRPVLLNYQG